MGLREAAAKGIMWSVIHRWGRAALATATFIVLSRLLRPEDFGLVALACVFTTFIEVFVEQGFTAAIVQRPDLDAEHLDTAFWGGVVIGTVSTVAGVALSGPVAVLCQEPRLGPVLAWLSTGFLLKALASTQVAVLQRQLAFKALAVRSLVAVAAGSVVGLGMAFGGFGVWSLVGQNLAVSSAGVLVLWTASSWRPGAKVSAGHYKVLFCFGAPVLGKNVVNGLLKRSDDFLIGCVLGPTALGYYAVGTRLLRLLTRLVTGVMNAVAFPIFSKLQHQGTRTRRAFYTATQYTALLSFPVFIGAAVLAPELVAVVFGAKWSASVPVMRILAFAGVLQSILLFSGTVIRASGKPAWEFAIVLATGVANLAAFILVVKWGIVAVSAAFVIVTYLLAPLAYFAVRKLLNINFVVLLKQLAPATYGTLAMAGTLLALKHLVSNSGLPTYLQLALYAAAAAASYIFLLVAIAPAPCLRLLDFIKLAAASRRTKPAPGIVAEL